MNEAADAAKPSLRVAQQMYEILCAADITAAERAVVLDILGALVRRL